MRINHGIPCLLRISSKRTILTYRSMRMRIQTSIIDKYGWRSNRLNKLIKPLPDRSLIGYINHKRLNIVAFFYHRQKVLRKFRLNIKNRNDSSCQSKRFNVFRTKQSHTASNNRCPASQIKLSKYLDILRIHFYSSINC